MWNGMGCKKRVKNPKFPKIHPVVPVQVRAAPVHSSNFSFFFLFFFFNYFFHMVLFLYFCKLGTVVPM